MKKSTKAAIALSSLTLYSSVFAGGVEVPPPTMWDFYVGGSAVGYGYEDRLNSVIHGTGTPFNPGTTSAAFPAANVWGLPSVYRNMMVTGGLDLGVGIWADRGYFGVEGRYDFGRMSAQHMHVVAATSNPLPAEDLPAVNGNAFQSLYYDSTMRNNASVVLKIGYQLLPRTMTYFIAGWARTTYRLSHRTFSATVSTAAEGATSFLAPTREFFAERVFKRNLNGGTVGFGASHLLVDGLSAFAEFAMTSFHIPTERRIASVLATSSNGLAVGANTFFPCTDILSFNYYHYNLRVGLNWSFASLF